jgi:hypothetical protein
MSKHLFASAARSAALVAVALVVLHTPQAARAELQISADLDNRLHGRGSFEGTLSYSYDPLTENGRLLLTLTNLNRHVEGGYITGVIFNVDSHWPDASATLLNGPDRLLDAHRRNGKSFGNPFDAGAALKGRFLAGGRARDGVAPGQSVTFEFEINARDAASLSSLSFIDGRFDHNFLVRFRKFNGGGGDIVPGQVGAIPGPSALVALAIGALATSRRRRA